MASDEKDFRDLVLKGFWHDLKDHLERDAIIVVAGDLDLMTVADYVTQDKADVIQQLISRQQLAKPTPQQLAAWSAMPLKEFSFVIAQPFVLIQEAGH